MVEKATKGSNQTRRGKKSSGTRTYRTTSRRGDPPMSERSWKLTRSGEREEEVQDQTKMLTSALDYRLKKRDTEKWKVPRNSMYLEC